MKIYYVRVKDMLPGYFGRRCLAGVLEDYMAGVGLIIQNDVDVQHMTGFYEYGEEPNPERDKANRRVDRRLHRFLRDADFAVYIDEAEVSYPLVIKIRVLDPARASQADWGMVELAIERFLGLLGVPRDMLQESIDKGSEIWDKLLKAAED